MLNFLVQSLNELFALGMLVDLSLELRNPCFKPLLLPLRVLFWLLIECNFLIQFRYFGLTLGFGLELQPLHLHFHVTVLHLDLFQLSHQSLVLLLYFEHGVLFQLLVLSLQFSYPLLVFLNLICVVQLRLQFLFLLWGSFWSTCLLWSFDATRCTFGAWGGWRNWSFTRLILWWLWLFFRRSQSWWLCSLRRCGFIRMLRRTTGLEQFIHLLPVWEHQIFGLCEDPSARNWSFEVDLSIVVPWMVSFLPS